MERPHQPGSVAAIGLALICSMTWCPRAFALDPSLDVSQYAHGVWRVRDGFTKGRITSIAQTPDGYLWLGTEFGLFRFDGVRAVPWQPPPDQHLPSTLITKLIADRRGTLWIGTSKGLASWRDRTLTRYDELIGYLIQSLLEDREGSVWAGGFAIPAGKLCSIQSDRVRCYGEDGRLGRTVVSLLEDSRRYLWAGVVNGLWRWKPDPPVFYPVEGETNSIAALSEDADGALVIGMTGDVRRRGDGKNVLSLPGFARLVTASRLLRDRESSLWVGTHDRGLMHIHQGKTDVFAQVDGLSGNDVLALLEDREGNLWVATDQGLDRFRDFSAATLSAAQGLSSAQAGPLLTAKDGSIWIATSRGLNRWQDGRLTIYRERSAPVLAGVREITSSGLPDGFISALFQDSRERIWVATLRAVGYLEHDRFIAEPTVPGGIVRAMAEDTRGDLWIAQQNLGLFRSSRDGATQKIPWANLGRQDFATALATDAVERGLWVGFLTGGLSYVVDGRVQVAYDASNGLGAGAVNDLRFDHEGTLWAATGGGLTRVAQHRLATLSSQNGLPCDGAQGLIEDQAHAVWLYMDCGLVRIARPELDAWTAAIAAGKEAKRMVSVTLFDATDGVMSHAGAFGMSPQFAQTRDGRLWFLPGAGVSVLDPHHLPINRLPPAVQIEQITADRKTHEVTSAENAPVRLPALIRDLQIDYTALSFVAPEKVRFKYKLEGYDPDWRDPGTRRQAFYNDLPPRSYRFRVIASNNSGVWNETGASLDFSVDPAYYQTTWFAASIAAATVLLLAALYQLRLRQLSRQFNMRMDERVNERMRIARDLHDTLLQSFHGLLFRFQAATNLLPERPAEAKRQFESAIDQAAQAITDGRDAVQNLRGSVAETQDLALSLRTLGEELATAEGDGSRNRMIVEVAVEGAPRNLHPILRDDIYRIAGEALRNAFKHARARRIEVQIRYDHNQFQLRVRDDGKGIDRSVLHAPQDGHFGLSGMRERAELVGGHLDIWSDVGLGTEVDLRIPSAAAYATPRARSRLWSLLAAKTKADS